MWKIIFLLCLVNLSIPWTTASSEKDSNYLRLLNKSKEIREYINADVKLCDDFYQFTCGNFQNDQKMFGIQLSKNYYKNVFKYLNNSNPSNESPYENKIRKFYKSCVNYEEDPKEKLQFYLDIMEEFGGMPLLKGYQWQEEEFDWMNVIGRILRKYRHLILVGVVVEPDFTNTDINRLFIGEQLDMMSEERSIGYDDMIRPWQYVLVENYGADENEALEAVHEMVTFAKKLSKGVKEDPVNLDWHKKNKLTLLDIMDRKYGPTLNFTKLVTTWLGHDYRLPVYEYKENYLKKLKSIIEETSKRTVANYILWTLIQKFDFDGENNITRRQRSCAGKTRGYFYKFIDNQMYRNLYLSNPKYIENAVNMFENLRETFKDFLNSPISSSGRWMSNETRNKALEKLYTIKFIINGYLTTNFSALMDSLQITEDNYLENVLNIIKQEGHQYSVKINRATGVENYAFMLDSPVYLSDYNSIVIPMNIMFSGEIWNPAYPKALLYANVGFLIGHELTHAFDDTGRHYDSKGNYRNWWDTTSSANFESRVDCLRQQFNSLLNDTEFPSQNENIADVNGLNLAYHAYNQWVSENPNAHETLPELEAYNSKQLFFIAASQVWCTTVGRRRLFSNIHSASEVKIWGMMSNCQSFADEFKCDVDSRMNPQKKCVFY